MEPLDSQFVQRQCGPKEPGVADCQKNPVAMPAQAQAFPTQPKGGVECCTGVSCFEGNHAPKPICQTGWEKNEKPDQRVHSDLSGPKYSAECIVHNLGELAAIRKLRRPGRLRGRN